MSYSEMFGGSDSYPELCCAREVERPDVATVFPPMMQSYHNARERANARCADSANTAGMHLMHFLSGYFRSGRISEKKHCFSAGEGQLWVNT